MSKKKELIFLTATIILGVLLVCVKLTGPVWHCIFGIMIVIASVKPICMRTVKMKHLSQEVQITDLILLVSLVSMAAT